MRLIITLTLVALCGPVRGGDSAWEIVKVEASKDHPGHQEVTICNSSEKPVELVRAWPEGKMAAGNVCYMPTPTHVDPRFAAISRVRMPLFAELCHYPAGWKMYMTVEPGDSVKAILPSTNGFSKAKLGLLLRQKGGRVLVGQLEGPAPKDK